MKNACIIGYGAIGPIHAMALEHTENARFYAVCDIDPARLDACREQYDVKCLDHFDAVLADEQIDSVHICTPHYLHFDMIRRALAAGKTVVAEKPATMTKSEWDQLKALPGADKICLVLQNRYNPSIVRLKEMAQSGEYGEIRAVRAFMTWNRTPEYYRSGAWRGKWATEGGGVLINQAVHTLDFMTYIAGGVDSLRANSMNYSLQDVIETEDTFTAYMRFQNGAGGIFFATNAYPINSAPEVEVVFEKKTVRYAYGRLTADGEVLAEDVKPTVGKDYWGSGHERLIRKYYDEQVYFSPADAEDTMNVMFAMYASAAENGKEQILGD